MFYHLWDFILASADYLLIVLTLVVAVIGIAWPQTEDSRQPTSNKRILTFAVVLIGIVSVLKIYSDNRDKSFLQLALSSTLLPAGSVYDSFYEDVRAAVAERAKADKLESVEPKAVELIPWHGAVGMIAIIKFPIEGVLVLDKSDVGLMYANEIRKDPKAKRELIEALLKKEFRPADLKGEFLDKSAIVGFLTYCERRHRFPQAYYYDHDTGVTLIAADGTPFVVSAQELSSTGKDKEDKYGAVTSLLVFQRVQELFRNRL